jgi:hypothetical protein
VVTLPTVVDAGVVVHEVIPALPVIDHVSEPLGAVAPDVPVTVVVKTRVEFSAPLPEPARTTVGVAFAMTTVTGEVAESEV